MSNHFKKERRAGSAASSTQDSAHLESSTIGGLCHELRGLGWVCEVGYFGWLSGTSCDDRGSTGWEEEEKCMIFFVIEAD